MKREQIAGIATGIALAAVLVVLAALNRGANEAVEPSDVVFDLFQRAKEGDVKGYFACFNANLRTTVESSAEDMGQGAFRQQIKSLGAQVKGVRVTEERRVGNEARLEVELVYADRSHNDIQTFTVRKRGSRWLVAEMTAAERIEMPIPYGTPAYPLELDKEDARDESDAAGG